MLAHKIGDGITVVKLYDRTLPQISAYAAELNQVWTNLIDNAVAAMAGVGTLTVRTGRDEGFVLVEIGDTGPGVPPAIRERIFEPFFTTKDVGKGTGLGLATVYGFIKQSGGYIYVDSELEQGTTFRIFIPRYVAAADDVQTPQLAETAVPSIAGAISAADDVKRAATDLTGHGTILLVEDEEGLRALNARGLISRGYRVIEAGTGVEAIEQFEQHGGDVDLVVSDVVMPEMDGPTLFKELRQRNPELKIIFVSGYAEDAFQKSLPDPDSFNFLPKPFTLKQLVAVVKETMAQGAPAS
jgi:two-component system cell cycle sensor histidine kinase/response regulator CckA